MEIAGVAFGLVFILLMAVGVAGLVVWVVALVDCLRTEDHVYRAAGSDKVVWVLVVGLAGWIGAAIYWFTIRPKLEDVEASGVQPAYGTVPYPVSGPPPGWYQSPDDPRRRRWWDGTRWTEHLR